MIERIIAQDKKLSAYHIGRSILGQLGALLTEKIADVADGRVVVATDRTVNGLFGIALRSSLSQLQTDIPVFEMKPGEDSKSFQCVQEAYQFLAASAVGRDGTVIALGGGVVSDLAGFAAATWMRGIRFVIVPTTLEAMIDAAIGGKTAINTPDGKNLVGVFHPPALVAIDPDCLATLPARDLRAGLAESVKHAVLFSPQLLEWHERNLDAILGLEPSALLELIDRNVTIKGSVVSRDPWETTGERMMLNFGHTIGHAIEASCGYALRHGECVSLGMVAACRISARMGLLDNEVVERITSLLRRIGLPTRMEEGISTQAVLSAIKHDKKRQAARVRFVLLEGIGRPVIRDDVDEAMIVEACASLRE